MENIRQMETLDRNTINIEMEKTIKKRLATHGTGDCDTVYTLGIGIPYSEMVRLMNVCDESDDFEDEENIYIVTGSDQRIKASGIVFTGADNEKMFFGLLGDEPTTRPHPLEDVNSVAKDQSWCVGKIEFDTKEEEINKKEDALSSLLRSYILYFSRRNEINV